MDSLPSQEITCRDGCGRLVTVYKGSGLSNTCYRRERLNRSDGPRCETSGCNGPRQGKDGLCSACRKKLRRWGNLESAPGRGAPGRARKSHNQDGARLSQNGYRLVRRPGAVDAGLWVLEHRLVMEEHLGRALRSDESIHHRNGSKLDNRLENLELWVRFQPTGQRVEDLLAWAHELIARYESPPGSVS